MLKIAIVFAVALGTASALAQNVPPSGASADQPDIKLSSRDIDALRDFVSKATVSIKQPDGSTHPLVDGLALLDFFGQRAAMARHDAAEAAEAAKHPDTSQKPSVPPRLP